MLINESLTELRLQIALGIDPLREEAKKNKIINAIFAILYMAKIFLTGFTMKGESAPPTSVTFMIDADSLMIFSA